MEMKLIAQKAQEQRKRTLELQYLQSYLGVENAVTAFVSFINDAVSVVIRESHREDALSCLGAKPA